MGFFDEESRRGPSARDHADRGRGAYRVDPAHTRRRAVEHRTSAPSVLFSSPFGASPPPARTRHFACSRASVDSVHFLTPSTPSPDQGPTPTRPLGATARYRPRTVLDPAASPAARMAFAATLPCRAGNDAQQRFTCPRDRCAKAPVLISLVLATRIGETGPRSRP